MSDELAALRARHGPRDTGDDPPVCGYCELAWPCDAVTLLDRCAAVEADAAWLRTLVAAIAALAAGGATGEGRDGDRAGG